MDENKKYEVVDAGYEYTLKSEQADSQVLRFIKKEVDDATNTLVLVNDGTTNEAVIEVLIDRLRFLDAKMPSEHNQVAIDRLNDALRALNMRTAERVERGVEGTHTA